MSNLENRQMKEQNGCKRGKYSSKEKKKVSLHTASSFELQN